MAKIVMQILDTLATALFGACLGGFIVWVLLARRQGKLAAFDEIKRHERAAMRALLGHEVSSFSPAIVAISEQFCTIYAQANDAEHYGLDQICGVAYGRALEFLVKDYAKRDKPEAAEKTEKATLHFCIQNFVTDPDIRGSTDLARWARNDETHYVRDYKGRDIKDLKRLIKLTVAFIENSEQRRALARDAEEEKRLFDASRQQSKAKPERGDGDP